MPYPTILVNAEPSPQAAAIAACAARLAPGDRAHVVGLASTGIAPLLYQSNASCPPLPPEAVQALTAVAREALARFTAVATAAGAVSCEERLTDDAMVDSLSWQARYSDLVVTGQAAPGYPAGPAGTTAPHDVILRCPRPVLVVPHAGAGATVGARPLLGWDGGMASSRAVHAALPLLRRAALTTVAIFDPGRVYLAHGPLPGADLATYLARNGVALEVVVRNAAGDAGAALLALAAERGADLLITGCYGHSRLREWLLGGATRTILEHMTLPVMMAR